MTEQQPEAQSSNMAQAESTSYGKSPLRVSYKVPFSLRLRYAITSIAHFFRIMPPQPNYAESPEFLPIKNGERVGSYCTSLRMLYINPKMAHLDRKHWKVAEIKTYKDKSTTVKHEYLIATLSDGDRGEVFLRIDRRLQDSSAKAFGKALIGRRSSSVPNPHSSDSDSGKQDGAQPNDENANAFTKFAVDEVAIVTPNLDKQKLVEHHVFESEQRVSLPQFIVLTCAINNYSSEYHLFGKNCYWFCFVAVVLLQKLSTGSLPDLSVRGQQGTWLGLPTDKLWKDVNFEMLSTMYDTMWSAFENEVCSITENLDITDTNGSWQIDSIINHPDNRQAKEEKKRADKEARLRQEEQKRAEQAERRAEESDKRAEEEKRHAEEERRHAEEERRRAEQLERQLADLKAQLAQSKGKGPSDVFSRQWVDFHCIAT
jgi:hypothetical protein